MQRNKIMRRTLFIIITLTIFGTLFISGCSKTSSDNESEGDVIVKTQAEYEAEAKEQITEDNMEEEFQEEMNKVKDAYSPEDLDLEEIVIRPRKSDIFVTPLSLVWSPWRVGMDGIAEPHFHIEA